MGTNLWGDTIKINIYPYLTLCNHLGYNENTGKWDLVGMVIRTFKNKKLKKFFETGDRSGIHPSLAAKIELILDRLDASTHTKDMNYPGSDFHPLKGEFKGYYSVHVNGNWCIIYRFVEGEALNVDLLDYH